MIGERNADLFSLSAIAVLRNIFLSLTSTSGMMPVANRHIVSHIYAAVPMVEAMVALVLADALLQHYAQCQILPMDPVLQGNELPKDVRHATLAEQAALYSEH